MEIERAIEILNPEHREHYDSIETVIETVNEACRMCMRALEKQIPKKPTFEGDGYDDSGNIIYDTWICPCCEDRYEVDYERHNHCPTCGQTIDWSDT